MKKTAVKRISAVLLSLVLIFTLAVNSFAETVQDRVENWLQGILDEYQSSDPDSQASLQDRFNAFLEENGLDDIDLSGLGDTDFADILAGLGDGSVLEQFAGLAGDAWNSGLSMIMDAFGGGSGTSDGKNTATTSPQHTSPNVIVPATSAVSGTQAVGMPTTVIPPVSSEQPTDATTAPNIVGAGITTAEPAANDAVIDDAGINSSSVVVFTVLSVSTLAVIIVIVIFFVIKRRQY